MIDRQARLRIWLLWGVVLVALVMFDRRLNRIEHTYYTCARDSQTHEIVCIRPTP